MAEYPCPCCGYLVFDEEPGSYDICAVCGWEDDLSQLRFATWEEGPTRRHWPSVSSSSSRRTDPSRAVGAIQGGGPSTSPSTRLKCRSAGATTVRLTPTTGRRTTGEPDQPTAVRARPDERACVWAWLSRGRRGAGRLLDRRVRR
ncbi:MAG: hypothetical protein J2P22_11530 [Nocardioides sp.]|nr:hypothetical protein [Nocardioides sp.]